MSDRPESSSEDDDQPVWLKNAKDALKSGDADEGAAAEAPGAEPAEPAAPAEPAEPIQDAEPEEPEEPVQDAEPEEPVQDTDPEKPAEPAEPAEEVSLELLCKKIETINERLDRMEQSINVEDPNTNFTPTKNAAEVDTRVVATGKKNLIYIPMSRSFFSAFSKRSLT